MSMRLLPLLGLCATLLIACQEKETATPAAAGQVIARVNKTDVTVHEFRNELRQAGIQPDQVNDEVTRAVLQEIVRRKILVERATAAGLDREPTVLLDLLRAREQVLATAFFQREVQAKVAGIATEEVERYIASNPLRFAGRMKLAIDQVTVPRSALTAGLYEATMKLKSLGEVEASFKNRGVAFSRGAGTIYSSDLPEGVWKTIEAKLGEDIFFFQRGDTTVFFAVTGQEPQPLAGDEAAALARQQLANDLIRSEMKQAFESSGIRFEGEYARIMQGAAGGPAGAEPRRQ